MTKLNGPGLAAVGVGSIILYAGIKGYSSMAVVQNLITGKPIATDLKPTNPLTVATDSSAAIAGGTQTFGTTNKGLGEQMAAARGWTGGEWDALDKLWTRESSWSNTARNAKSGAYGIPQALPPTKMPTAAQAPTSDPTAQIQWGLDYIASRYGTPTMAWAHEQANNWY